MLSSLQCLLWSLYTHTERERSSLQCLLWSLYTHTEREELTVVFGVLLDSDVEECGVQPLQSYADVCDGV